VRLAVADGWTVAAALDDGPGHGYLLVERGSQLARSVSRVAERWWNRAELMRPDLSAVEGAHWSARSATETAIIAALARGDTDETVARRLGITPRTVRRYVADVSERYGATSRMQLGVLLGRSGAVCDRPDGTGFRDTAAG
jgi:DNA-binding NarL/FixJ family response regulator